MTADPCRKRLLALCLAAGLLTSAGSAAAAQSQPGQVAIEVASLATREGPPIPYELGVLQVRENRASPGSRSILVGFARFKALRPTGAPPLFVLPGGPGDSYITSLTDSDERERRLVRQILAYREVADVVLVDQRGFSSRGDRLTYRHPLQDRPLDKPSTLDGDSAAFVASAKAAVAAHRDKDLAGYTVVECAHDVDELRQALGYEKITLVGQSFGSQWSFAVMRLHPESVARALLSGVEPLDNGYDMPGHAFTALQRLAWEAEKDPRLQPYLPAGGLMGALGAVRERLAARPVSVRLADATTGKPQTVVLGLADFQQSLFAPADMWPAFILSLYHEHYEEWAQVVARRRKAGAETGAMIGPLIDTSLGVTPERRLQLSTDPALQVVGAWNFGPYMASAEVWPTLDVGDELRRPVQTDIPVLFVHGDWDTSTPIENMLGVLPYFRNSRALVVRRGGHGARAALLDQQPAMLALVLDYLRTGDLSRAPAVAELPAPAFRTPSFAPPGKAAAGAKGAVR